MLLLLPLIGAVLGLLFKSDKAQLRWGLGVTVATALASLPLYTQFDRTTALYQFVEVPLVITGAGARLCGRGQRYQRVAGALVSLCGDAAVCALLLELHLQERMLEFMFVLLIIETCHDRCFRQPSAPAISSSSGEAMLIPMYLMIAIWGGARKGLRIDQIFSLHLRRQYFLSGVDYCPVSVQTGSFFIPELMEHSFSFTFQAWIFLGCAALAFAVKVPMFPPCIPGCRRR